MKKLILIRTQQDCNETLGQLHVFSDGVEIAKFKTLELPWVENKRRISCIPEGRYPLSPRSTSKFGDHFILKNVDNRDGILIHKGNYVSQTEGCILIGMINADLNRDGVMDISGSAEALRLLTQFVTDESELLIVKL